MVLADADPSVSTGCDLLEVDEVVSGRTVSVIVKLETIATQSLEDEKDDASH